MKAKSPRKVLAGLVLFEVCEEECITCLSPRFCDLLAISGVPWLIETFF